MIKVTLAVERPVFIGPKSLFMWRADNIYVARVWAWLSEVWVKLNSRSNVSKRIAERNTVPDSHGIIRDKIVNCIPRLFQPFLILPFAIIEIDILERSGKPIRGDFEDSAVPFEIESGRTRRRC